MNIKCNEIRVLESAKGLESAGKEIPPDEVTYHILEHLPESLVIQLYHLPDTEFTVEEVRKQLLAEYDRQKSKPAGVIRNQALCIGTNRDCVIPVESLNI